MAMIAESSSMELAVKPKERQFQVVAVPGLFTRGRWQCWDYKEQDLNNDHLEFVDQKMEKLFDVSPTDVEQSSIMDMDKVSTIVVTSIAPAQSKMSGGASGNSFSEMMTTTTITSETMAELSPVVSSPRTHTHSIVEGVPIDPNGPLSPLLSLQIGNALSGIHSVNLPTFMAQLPALTGMESSLDESATQAVSSANVGAIDNKIEQAMDLVKTHLTYAVREEVEILRSTIVDLESKVAVLENQNQLLRQFAPPDVVANLAMLVQSAQQKAPPTASSTSSTTLITTLSSTESPSSVTLSQSTIESSSVSNPSTSST